MNDDINPCIFKKVCKKCLKVQVDERPVMCEALKCEYYTPCSKCSKNRKLTEIGKCNVCSGISPQDSARLRNEAIKERKESIELGRVPIAGVTINTKITSPGTPPQGLNSGQVEYYKSRWNDYKGYYRDPSAYFVCHLIILEEINISSLTDKMLETALERRADIGRSVTASISTMKMLKDQLPDREAEEEMDENKTIAAIYDAWLQEKKFRTKSGVSRILSPEAIALAPELTFKIDPHKLLERCGFKEIQIENAIDLIEQIPEDIQDSPESILEFFGFKLRDEYALEYDNPLVENINPEPEDILDVQ